eukprot:2003787-Alexandrium_andersonii.AAC.1
MAAGQDCMVGRRGRRDGRGIMLAQTRSQPPDSLSFSLGDNRDNKVQSGWQTWRSAQLRRAP